MVDMVPKSAFLAAKRHASFHMRVTAEIRMVALCRVTIDFCRPTLPDHIKRALDVALANELQELQRTRASLAPSTGPGAPDHDASDNDVF